jgi:hypothetical protein
VRLTCSPAPFLLLLSAACLSLTSLAVVPSAQGSSSAIPRRWVGARFDDGRIGVSVANPGGTPRAIVIETDPKRSRNSLTVTDVAFDVKREVVYLGTCCEPGSGQLRRVDLRASPPALTSDDQGFAVDAAGGTSTVARTDTFGTLAVRPSPKSQQEIRAQSGASDVAVDASGGVRVIALIQSSRLRALIPTASSHDPAILVLQLNAGQWAEVRYPLPANTTYCGVVALTNGSIGLLAGQVDPANPLACTGDRLDIYDTAKKELRASAVRFPGTVRHLSVDDSSTFLIFTTVDGAVRWQTLAGDAGVLATRGFVAADW